MKKTILYLLPFISYLLMACSTKNDEPLPAPDAPNNITASAKDSILIVYFSRRGFNYNGSRTDLKWTDKGNTAVFAEYIQQHIGGTTFEIVPAVPYPDDYMETVRINVEEERANARPAIKNRLDIDWNKYRYIFIGSPVWNSQAPMIMHTFYDTYRDALQGKTLIPFGTHEMSGIGNLERAMRTDVGSNARYLQGLGLIGRTINTPEARTQVHSWLNALGFQQVQN